MLEPSSREEARTASEARDAVATRTATSSATAINAAMQRYLTAAQYRELGRQGEQTDREEIHNEERAPVSRGASLWLRSGRL